MSFRGPMESWRDPKGDGGLLVQFFIDAVKLEKESEKAGRPIFEDREFVSIRIPGDKNTEIIEEIRLRLGTQADYTVRFAEQYARFKANEKQQYVGTPLSEWPAMTPARIKMLEFHNIYVVEHMAAATDVAIQKLGMDGVELRRQAQSYLLKAEGTDAEKELLKDKLATLQAQVAELVKAQQPKPEGHIAPVPTEISAAKRKGGRPSNAERARRAAEAA